MTPVVGYVGGKRRMLPVLRPYFDAQDPSNYVEPFVGMGAVYLDLRARGFAGLSILADTNSNVRMFWRCVHDERAGQELLAAVKSLASWPPTVDGYKQMLLEPVELGVGSTARFLWLTNYTYANLPPVLVGNTWKIPRSGGTKLRSAEKWGKTFPWLPCVERLSHVIALLAGRPCIVEENAIQTMKTFCLDCRVFADPPYKNTASYAVNDVDYTPHIFACRAPRIVLTEARQLDPPPGWIRGEKDLVARVSSPGRGTSGTRREFTYTYGY